MPDDGRGQAPVGQGKPGASEMNKMINSKTDHKNIGLVKNLWQLRQALDVFCLISVNANAINKTVGGGKKFFVFVQILCLDLIILYISKIFEKEKKKRGGYELNSIDGVLRAIENDGADVWDSEKIKEFVKKYGSGSDNCGLAAISAVVEVFTERHHEALSRFKTLRDKRIAHGESKFSAEYAPSYDEMEQLFDFGLDFYMLVSRAIVSVIPVNLNNDRKVKTSLKKLLKTLGCEEIKTEME